MKSSSASSEDTFYNWSVTLLSMKIKAHMIHRRVLLHSSVDRGFQHKVQEQTPQALQGCPSPWFGEAEGRAWYLQHSRTDSTTPIPKHSAPATRQCLLTSYSSIFQRWKQKHFRCHCLSQLFQHFIKERNSFIRKVAHKRVAVQYFW